MNNKKRIVISSTLKPVDDIRSFRKIGDSLGKTNYYDVKIIGYGSKKTSDNPNIEFISTGVFGRLSLKRFFLPLVILRKIIKIKPHLLIVSSHELLLIIPIVKLLNRNCKFIYDIRENYYANIRFQNVFPLIFRVILAKWVRLKEHITIPLIDHLLVAEKGYVKEISFIRNHKHLIIENKSLYGRDSDFTKSKVLKNIIFTGNLSVNSGALKAIQIFEKIKQKQPAIKMLLIGHSPSKSFTKILLNKIESTTDCELIIDNEPVAYTLIKEKILKADLAIVSYEINESNQNCMPTKVFEYLSMGVPFICELGSNWGNNTKATEMSFNTELDDLNVIQMINWYQNISYNYDKNQFTWSNEAVKLNNLIDDILL